MDRRSWVKTGGMAALGLGLGGCGGRSAPPTPAGPALSLPRVRASWDRVIRTTVGLRPFRPSGFRVAVERFDDKTVVHNYGHGGAGHSLSWGTGQLVADLALGHADRRAAVLGSGIVGLTAARQLQRHGFDVVIYTEAVPPNTTSNMSLAAFTPTSGLFETRRRTPEWEAQFDRAVGISYRQLQLLAGREYGISWINTFTLTDEAPSPTIGPERSTGGDVRLETGNVTLPPGQHPFPGRYALYRSALRIEPSIYLDSMVRDVRTHGATIVIRRFDSPRDLMALDEDLIVNCTGLGSGTLFGDDEIIPVKGQLTFLVPQPEINYRFEGRAPGGGRIGVMPRSDGIALGHTMERGVWSLEPNPDLIRQNVERAIALFSAMRAPNADLLPLPETAVPDVIPSVESFFGLES